MDLNTWWNMTTILKGKGHQVEERWTVICQGLGELCKPAALAGSPLVWGFQCQFLLHNSHNRGSCWNRIAMWSLNSALTFFGDALGPASEFSVLFLSHSISHMDFPAPQKPWCLVLVLPFWPWAANFGCTVGGERNARFCLVLWEEPWDHGHLDGHSFLPHWTVC